MIKNKHGFTLIETVMAMVILASGLLLLANSWSGSFSAIKKTQLSTEVAALLERKMIETEIEYQGKPLDSIPEEQEDDFGSEYPQFSWRMNSREFEIPDFSATLTSQSGGADELTLTIMKTLSEHLKKSIKEVKVTVIYKGSKKPMEFSATQYFVDFDKQLPMPGLPSGSMGGM